MNCLNLIFQFVFSYDEDIDKITKYQRVPLSDIAVVELGPLEAPAQSALQIFNKVIL
jgi:hypothetical protein